MQQAEEQEYVEYVTARLPALRRLAYALCRDSHRADDVVQQTITRLYTRWRRASAATSLDRYVRTMLIRVYLDEKRLGWSRVRLTAAVPERPAAGGSDIEERELIRAALARVPRRQRAVLVLRFVCDLPVDEVAQTLGVSPGTVKSQTSHGLAALRRIFEAEALSALEGGIRDGRP